MLAIAWTLYHHKQEKLKVFEQIAFVVFLTSVKLIQTL